MRSLAFLPLALALLPGCGASPSLLPPAPATAIPGAATPALQSFAPHSALPPHVHPDFDPGLVTFTLHLAGVDSSLATLSAFVMPGATLEFSTSGGSGAFDATVEGAGPARAGSGVLVRSGASSWTWKAPSRPGDVAIRIRDRRGGNHDDGAVLHVFVLHPYDGGERIGSYRIGHYQSRPKDDDEAYRRPEGLVEVTAANLDTAVSPHFRLGQFVCKEGDQYPKYIALRTALLVKLETLLAALAEHGLPAASLHVMSGYRTPAYNAGIGNETIYSRHTYGDAADVFLDRDGDGVEDDLNGDGKSTREDARILYQLAEDTLDDSLPPQMAGGLSAYGPTDAHGPFVHIDARGKRARW